MGAEFVLVAELHAVTVVADLVGAELVLVAALLDVGRVAQEHDTRR